MTKPRILIVEDAKADQRRLSEIAENYGLPVTVGSTADAMGVLRAGDFDLVILDLMLGDGTPQNTIDAFRMALKRTPVIVVTGIDDEAVKRDCESIGWSWVPKDSQYFGRVLSRAIDAALDREDSGTGFVQRSNTSQLDAIIATLADMKASQKAMQMQLDSLVKLVGSVMDQMHGPADPITGVRRGGCVATCERTQGMFTAGDKWRSAVWIGTASAFGGGIVSLVFWFVLKVIQ